MKVIAVQNFKGGVGKTTTALNLAYELNRVGKKVLLIDLDPQGTLSGWLYTPDGEQIKRLAYQEKKSLANVLVPKQVGVSAAGLDEVTYRTRWPGIDVVPATLQLLTAKDGILQNNAALHFAIDDLGSIYDYVIIDTRPDLDIKTTSAFVAAEYIILPVKFDGAMLEGLEESVEALKETVHELRLSERHFKVLRTFQRPNTQRDRAGKAVLHKYLSDENIFKTYIHDTVKVAAATMAGNSIREFTLPTEAGYKAALDYEELAKEVIAWVESEA